MPIKTIFLDRDGVINEEVNYLHKIDDFKFIDGIFQACQNFENLGYKIIIVSNQSGIARGYFTEKDFKILNDWMINQFHLNEISILDVYYCARRKCIKNWCIGSREHDRLTSTID